MAVDSAVVPRVGAEMQGWKTAGGYHANFGAKKRKSVGTAFHKIMEPNFKFWSFRGFSAVIDAFSGANIKY